MLRRQGLIAAALFAAAVSGATEIHLSYGVLERLISQQVFTDDGRKYVKGSKTAKCTFAYLENPKIASAGGQIAIRARFTGRSAIDMFGHCMGVGDAFDLTVFGKPVYDKGRVAFKDISVQTDRDSFYIRRVRQALMQTLSRQFDYDIRDDAKKLLEQQDPNAPFRRELIRFDVTQIQAAQHALVLTVDFAVAVK